MASGEYMDLSRHDFEDMPGKTVDLNGRDYILLKPIGAGGEGTVFPLLNVRSGIANLVGKVYHYLKGSPEYEDTLSNLSQVMFALGASGGDPEPTYICPEALYEAAGGLIGVMENLRGTDTDMAYSSQLNESVRLLKLGDFEEAASLCDQILEHNPDHALALVNKSTALASAGNVYGAIGLLAEAVDIEPSEPKFSRQLARYFGHVHRAEAGLATLQKSLGRWRWDGWTWKLLAQMAVEWDLTDLVGGELDYGFAALEDRLEDTRREVTKSVERRKLYETELESGLGILAAGDWRRALSILLSAQSISRNNGLALLGAHICRFHLSLWADISAQTAEVFQANSGARRLAAAVISMIGLVHSGNIQGAKDLALFLAEDVELPIDLPRIPVAIRADCIIESLPLHDIVSAVTTILEYPRILDEEKRKVQELLTRYDELERMTVSKE